MIQNAEAAAMVANHIQEGFRQLDDSAAVVRNKGTEVEVAAYLAAVGPICADIIFRLMEPLYRLHPELAPKGWDIEGPA